MLGEPHWLEDERFADDGLRGLNGAPISDRMQRWCAELTTSEALEALAAARLPAGPILSPQEVLDDEHFRSEGFFDYLPFPGATSDVPYVTPIELTESCPRIQSRAPLLGEHTDEILSSIGYCSETIMHLRHSGAI
jgi:crotonobetainyl-CoA:carnitine CoA-transferase CaiB-like acyl-CoA transferase